MRSPSPYESDARKRALPLRPSVPCASETSPKPTSFLLREEAGSAWGTALTTPVCLRQIICRPQRASPQPLGRCGNQIRWGRPVVTGDLGPSSLQTKSKSWAPKVPEEIVFGNKRRRSKTFALQLVLLLELEREEASKVRCGSATALQPRLPSHGLHCHLGSKGPCQAHGTVVPLLSLFAAICIGVALLSMLAMWWPTR